MELIFEKVIPESRLPNYSHPTDSGMDAYALLVNYPAGVVVHAGGKIKISIGVRASIPEGYELQLRLRSSLSSKGIIGAFGTIDTNYRGEIFAVLYNNSGCDFVVYNGDRIGQLVLAPVYHAEIREGKVDTNTDRGTGGFGSTGV